MVAEEGLTLLRLVIYTAATEITNLSFIKHLHLIWLQYLTFSQKVSRNDWWCTKKWLVENYFLIFKKINMPQDNNSNFLHVNDYLEVSFNYCSAFFLMRVNKKYEAEQICSKSILLHTLYVTI